MPGATHHDDDEMHELNQEADFLEAKVSVNPNGTTDEAEKLKKHHSDPEAQAMVIESLRSQVQDLFSQVSQLNSKLVRSYDRVSDLEDELHVNSSNLRQATVQISQLELERTQHLAALSTGLLVEKEQVTSELTRLMEKATDEAARRGQAESARAEIEKDLDDLSAGLFDQANRMVAEARFARARSEQKVTETEQALKSAEEVVGLLQSQMQTLQTDKEEAERSMAEMRATMGKGKWVARPDPARGTKLRLLCTHLPYHDFLQFIGHLRAIRPGTQLPPAMSTLLPLPFLARLIAEDSDPTVRLDLAPSLNWLTRRSVLAAIHSGQLTVEPMSTTTLLEELSPPSIPGTTIHTHVACALCGATILEPPSTKSSNLSPSRNGSWSSASALFKNPLTSISNVSNTNLTLPSSNPLHNAPPSEPPTQVYIFRLATSSSGLPVSIQQSNVQTRPTIYPLCTTGWCLNRLRTTCSLWAFVRTGVVERIWEETSYIPPASQEQTKSSEPNSPTSDKPPPPPARRSRMGIGALWGSMQRGLSGTRDSEKDPAFKSEEPEKKTTPSAPPTPEKRRLPPPPPSHPPLHAPIPKLAELQATASLAPSSEAKPTPPPLPQRNRTRDEHQRTPSHSDRPPLPPRSSTSTPVTIPPTNGSTATDQKATIPEKEVSGSTALEPEAPDLARADSHDSFATAEYPSSTSSRPSSPSTIPLPASGPSTPIQTEAALPNIAATAAQEEHAPADAAAPTPVTESTAPASVAPVSGVPPPLPRRAAARTRPTSVVAPVPPPVVESVEANGVTSSDTDTKPAEAPTETNGLHETEIKTDSQEALTITEKSGSDAVENSQEELSVQPTSAETPTTPHFDDRASHSSIEKVSTSPAVVSEVDPAENHTAELNGHAEKIEDGDEEDEFPGTFVTDATWEERTWKELVKLREYMFWARLGGRR